MNKFKSIFIFVVTIFTLMFSGCSGRKPLLTEITEESISTENADADLEFDLFQENEAMIVVHISGQVNMPDVYELPAGSRLSDAVKCAGGFTDQADKNYANLAEILEDGKKYQIYSVEETRDLQSGLANNDVANHYDADGKLDINMADKNELMTLSGIGESKASAIIEYRNINGNFSVIEDIRNVTGIGDGLYQRISDSIVVR